MSRCSGPWENSSEQSRQKSLPSWSFCFRGKGNNYIVITGGRGDLILWLVMSLGSGVLI